MLVLTRKRHQSLFIGDNIRITVLEIRGEQVRLGVDAPRSVAVQREEMFRELALTNQEACSANPTDVVCLSQLAAVVRSHMDS